MKRKSLTFWLLLPAAAVLISLPLAHAQNSTPLDSIIVGRWPGYIRGPARQVITTNHVAYLAMPGGLMIVDLSSVNQPHVLSVSAASSGLAVSGSSVYSIATSVEAGSLAIIDASDPTKPAVRGHLSLVAPRCVSVKGDVAFVGTLNGIAIVDVFDPLKPTLLSELGLVVNATGEGLFPLSVFVADGFSNVIRVSL